MKILMIGIIICMIAGVLSLPLLSGSKSKQLGRNGSLQASLTQMGPH